MDRIADLTLEEIGQNNTIIKQYHRGSYGRVYLIQKNDGEKYVVKKSFASDQQYSKYFEIKHDHIVTPIHSFIKESYQFIIFDEWDGNLGEILEVVTLQQLIIIFKNLVSALKYLESKGISHGDIKLANVLFKKKPFIIGLADFSFISKHQKQYRNDYLQLGLMMMKLMGYSHFQNIDKYQIDYTQISRIISENEAPDNDYGQIIWDMIQSGVNDLKIKTFAEIQEQIILIEKNFAKTKKARLSKGKFQLKKKKKCQFCLKNIDASNYMRHVKNCKGIKQKKINKEKKIRKK